MRKNQIILDEAARGVRRAFIGSVAGSATMLGVIGVAGAYGMPERLSAQSLSTALTSLQLKFTPMVDGAGPIVDRAMVMAAHVAPKPRSIAIESDDEVILQVPRSPLQGFALAAATPDQIAEPSPRRSPRPPFPLRRARPAPCPAPCRTWAASSRHFQRRWCSSSRSSTGSSR